MYGNIDEAEKSIEWFKGIFGDDFYLELQRHKTDNPLGNQETYEKQQQVNAVLLELGKKLGVKVIATNDVHFLNEEDAEAQTASSVSARVRTSTIPDACATANRSG